MATVKFQLQSKSSTAPIYLRLSLGRNKTLKRKTDFVIDAKAWSTTVCLPKERDDESKALKANLTKLEGHIIQQYNTDNGKGVLIDGNWLNNAIDSFYGRREIEPTEYITAYGDAFVESLPYKVTTSGAKGVTKDTVGKYRTIVDKLKGFETYKKKKYLIKTWI